MPLTRHLSSDVREGFALRTILPVDDERSAGRPPTVRERRL